MGGIRIGVRGSLAGSCLVAIAACGSFSGERSADDEKAENPDASPHETSNDAPQPTLDADVFEGGPTGTLVYVEHFDTGCRGFSVQGSATVSPSPASGHDSSGSCRVCLNQSGLASIHHDTAALPSGAYRLSVWQQNPLVDGDAGAKGTLALEPVTTAGLLRTVFSAAPTWQEQSLDMLNPADGALRITFTADGKQGSCIEFDDVVVTSR